MRVSVFLENDDVSVYSIGLSNTQEFNHGFHFNLPPEEVVRFLQAKEIWEEAHARLQQMLHAKRKRSERDYRRYKRTKRYKKWIRSQK